MSREQKHASIMAGRGSLVLLFVALLLCIAVMAFAGSTSVTMVTKQIELAKLKMVQEVPEGDEEAKGAAQPVGVVDAGPLLEDNNKPGEESIHNVSYPSLKRREALNGLIRGGLYGNHRAPRLERATSRVGNNDWCELEMLKTTIVQNASTRMCSGGLIGATGADPNTMCRMDRPIRQGNVTKIDDLKQFATFPHVPDVFEELSSGITPQQLAAYWKDYPLALFPICANWREHGSQFTFHALYTLRRWFRLHRWSEGNGHAGRGDVLTITPTAIEFNDVNANVVSNPPDATEKPIKSIPIKHIHSIRISPSARLANILWFVNITYDSQGKTDFTGGENTDGGNQQLPASLPFVLFEAPKPGVQSILRSLFVLHKPLFDRVYGPHFDLPTNKGDGSELVGAAAITGDALGFSVVYEDTAEAAAAYLPTSPSGMWQRITRWVRIIQPSVLPAPWPYTPCHKFDQQQLLKEAMENNNVDSYKLHWPYRCDQLRETDGCGQEQRIEARRQGLRRIPITTAITFAGFVRSFAAARFSLWENIVKPLQATPFAVTWNVHGRTKKTAAITKKMLIHPHRMQAEVAGLMMIPPHVNTSEYVQVYNYFDFVYMMMETKKHGFMQGGLYFLMSKAIQLVLAHETKFDIIIRARFDIVALVPMRIVRVWQDGKIPTAGEFKAKVQQALTTGVSLSSLIEDRVEYVMDFGASCNLQGVWWPQYTTIHTNKILKPPADTRYKFFGWQVCDWMEIGTYTTMAQLGGLMDYIDKNYVFSAAQWVDHAFYIAKGIAYQPTQMFLKIIRKKGKYFG